MNKMLYLGIRVYMELCGTASKIKYLFYYIFGIEIGNYNKLNDLEHIGFIDQDGLIHIPSKYKSLFNSNQLYINGDFLYKKRFSIEILVKNKTIYLKKQFGNDLFSFYNELSILHTLEDLDCVPKIYFVDYNNLSIGINYINGFVIREKLAKLGARIRDIDKINEGAKAISNKYCDLGVALNNVVSKELYLKIKQSVEKVHREKVLIVDVKYGNIIIKNEMPYLVDFNDSILLRRTPNIIFNVIKKYDALILESIFKYII